MVFGGLEKSRGMGVTFALILAIACAVPERDDVHQSNALPFRIVSMAPSITEVLFALGLGDRVVGVTRYCDFPVEAKSRAQVGGYLDPNFEAIVALRPDLVIVIQDQSTVKARIESFGIATLQIEHQNLAGIFASIALIAGRCGVGDKGRALITTMHVRLDRINSRFDERESKFDGWERPRVIVVVGRTPGEGSVKSVWAAGPGSYFDDVVRAAGGINACSMSGIAYPELSREGLASLDPDVIVDVIPEITRRGLGSDVALGEWASLTELRAVRSNRVVVLAADFMEIPGPRIVDAVEAVAAVIHEDD